jgi:hypothetical protein
MLDGCSWCTLTLSLLSTLSFSSFVYAQLSVEQMKEHGVDAAWIEYAQTNKVDTFAVPLGSGKDLVSTLTLL